MTHPKTKILQLAKLYSLHSQEEAAAKARKDDVNKKIKALLEDIPADERGHRTVLFDEPVEVGNKTLTGVKVERRVSRSLDEEVTELVLRAHEGLYDRAVTYEPVVQQDEIYAMYQEDLITQEEIDSMYRESVTFALKVV
jgi:hypothetical protein